MTHDPATVRTAVRTAYGAIASKVEADGCCAPSCCVPGSANPADLLEPAPDRALDMGYTASQLANLPDGANLGLGCGNPHAIAALEPGARVLDLGSGGGIDCLLAADQVGPTGHVIGVDMTAEMITLARKNAAERDNVEFRLGEIEHLPLADQSVDVVLSNCVVNLSPDQGAVYREAFRVLAPGGRLAISDVITTAPLPDAVRSSIEALVGCVANAASAEEIEGHLTEAGFTDVRVTAKDSRELIRTWLPGSDLENYVCSATIEATRP